MQCLLFCCPFTCGWICSMRFHETLFLSTLFCVLFFLLWQSHVKFACRLSSLQYLQYLRFGFEFSRLVVLGKMRQLSVFSLFPRTWCLSCLPAAPPIYQQFIANRLSPTDNHFICFSYTNPIEHLAHFTGSNTPFQRSIYHLM